MVLQGLVFHGFHGVLPEVSHSRSLSTAEHSCLAHMRVLVQEQVLGQKFRVDASLSCSLRRAGCTDDLEETVNYAQVYRCGRILPAAAVSSQGLGADTLLVPARSRRSWRAPPASWWRRWQSA